MKIVRVLACGLALGLMASAPAAAQDSRVSLSFNMAGGVPVLGDVHGGGAGLVLDLPTTVEARDYNDIYGTSLDWNLGVGFMASEMGEVRVQLFRSTGDATDVQVGDVATLPLFAQFDDYKALGVDVGWRQYFGQANGAVQPYAGGSMGIMRFDEINATFRVPAASVTLSDVAMYEASTELTFALSGGVLVRLNRNIGFTGGVDLRWHGDLNPIDGLAGTGLEPINDESRRWSLPISAGVLFRF